MIILNLGPDQVGDETLLVNPMHKMGPRSSRPDAHVVPAVSLSGFKMSMSPAKWIRESSALVKLLKLPKHCSLAVNKALITVYPQIIQSHIIHVSTISVTY